MNTGDVVVLLSSGGYTIDEEDEGRAEVEGIGVVTDTRPHGCMVDVGFELDSGTKKGYPLFFGYDEVEKIGVL